MGSFVVVKEVRYIFFLKNIIGYVLVILLENIRYEVEKLIGCEFLWLMLRFLCLINVILIFRLVF